YVQVLADGGMTRSGDIAKALACGADAVLVGSPFARAEQAPGRGYHWGSEAHHPDLPRGARVKVGTVGTLEQILCGPSAVADGSLNLVGAPRRHLVPLQQAHPWRAALPRTAQHRAGPRGAHRALAAARGDRTAPGPPGALPLPADPSRLGAGLHRHRYRYLRRARLLARPGQRAARAPPAVPQGGAAAGPRAQAVRDHRGDRVL